MKLKRRTPIPPPILGDPCADPRVDCAAYRAAAAASQALTPADSPVPPAVPLDRPSPPPAPAKVARNAVNALGRIIGAAATGHRVQVLPTERDRRQAICNACPHWVATANAGLGRCNLCGCTRYKTYFATERCPDDHW